MLHYVANGKHIDCCIQELNKLNLNKSYKNDSSEIDNLKKEIFELKKEIEYLKKY